MRKPISLTLKSKLMILLMFVCIAALTVYGIVANNLIIKDKTAYVFETALTISRSTAARARLEFRRATDQFGRQLKNYDPVSRRFLDSGKKDFGDQQSLQYLGVYQARPFDGVFSLTAELKKEDASNPTKGDEAATGLPSASKASVLIDEALNYGFSIRPLGGSKGLSVVAARFGQASDRNCVVAIGVFSDLTALSEIGASAFDSLLLQVKDGRFALGRLTSVDGTESSVAEAEHLAKEIANVRAPDGTLRLRMAHGEAYLVSFSQIGKGELFAVSVISEAKAFEVARVLTLKSILLIVTFSFVVILIAIFASRYLTSALDRLSAAARAIGQGKFQVEIDVDSNDEMGALAKGFKTMAGEIEKLLEETADKARMESELKTAKTVQDTLFPQPSASFGELTIAGYFKSASECGGDWWHYHKVGDRVYIWIADATGHGAPAALITSAAKSAVTILENLPDVSISQAFRLLNTAISATSSGKICMTAFVGCIDLKTGVLTYCNASHEPTILLSAVGELDFLMDNLNARLGESPESNFNESTVQLKPGDKLILYTDGVTELWNGSEKMFGDRRLTKLLKQNPAASPEEAREKLALQLEEFRGNEPLHDDVTFVVCQYSGQAA